MLADVFTPVGIYLRVRDRFRDTILLESTDNHASENSYSFICINAIGGIEITSIKSIETKYPGQPPERSSINNASIVPEQLWDYMQRYDVIAGNDKVEKFAQGLYGYTTYDAVQFFDTLKLSSRNGMESDIPLARYRLYQYVIAINHFKDELYLCENILMDVPSELPVVESLIRSKDVPVYPFSTKGDESSNMADEDYREMVRKGIQSCRRGDVFQIVLSRRF